MNILNNIYINNEKYVTEKYAKWKTEEFFGNSSQMTFSISNQKKNND